MGNLAAKGHTDKREGTAMKLPFDLALFAVLISSIVLLGCEGDLVTAPTTEAATVEPAIGQTRIERIEVGASRHADFNSNTTTTSPLPQGKEPTDDATTESIVIVSGVVTGADGKPAAGVDLQLYFIPDNITMSQDEDRIADRVTTDESGYYEVSGTIRRQMMLHVFGTGTPMMATLNTADLYLNNKPRPGTRRIRKDIALPESHYLSGQVVNEAGTPMPGLGIHIEPSRQELSRQLMDQRLHRARVVTTTTATGDFFTTGIAPGRWLVGTTHPDYAPVFEEITLPSTEPVILRLSSRGGTIVVRVLHKETGEPVGEMPVTASWQTDTNISTLHGFDKKSASDGTVEFRNIPAGQYRVVTGHRTDPLMYMAPPVPDALSLADDETTEVTLFVYSGHTITGTVYDKDTSKPVSGAVIKIGGNIIPTQPSISDESGKYTVSNVFSPWLHEAHLQVKMNGYSQENNGFIQIALPAHETAVIHDVPLVRNVTIKGIVVTEADVPIPHARVKLNRYPSTDPVPVAEDGTFTLQASPFSSNRVEADARGYAPAQSERLEVTSLDVTDVKVVLKSAGSVHGRVIDHNEMPVSGAVVSARYLAGRLEEVAVSGNDGRFSIQDAPSKMTLTASKRGKHADSDEVSVLVAPGEVKADVVLQLRESLSIAGRVITSQGEPVFFAQIMTSDNAHGTHTSPDGRFELANVPEGTHEISVFSSSFHKKVSDVKSGTTDLEIILEAEDMRNATLIGTVVDDDTGNSIADFAFHGRRSGSYKKLEEPGKFEISNLQSDQAFSVSIGAPGYAIEKFNIEPIPAGQTLEQSFRLNNGGAITGRVVDQITGAPLPGLVVMCWSGQPGRIGEYGVSPAAHTITNDNGRFTLGLVPDGENYTIQVKGAPTYSDGIAETGAVSGQMTDVPEIKMIKVDATPTINKESESPN